MQLKKLIPAVTACVLAVLLSLTLFLTAIPQASAADTPEPEAPGFIQSASGYLYGFDSAIYPYTCTVVVSGESNSSIDLEWEIVTACMDLRVEHNRMNNAFGTLECYSKVVFYYPELDEFEVQYECREGSIRLQRMDPLCIGMARTEVDGIDYGGEVHSVTAIFLVDGQVVTTMTWNRDQADKEGS